MKKNTALLKKNKTIRYLIEQNVKLTDLFSNILVFNNTMHKICIFIAQWTWWNNANWLQLRLTLTLVWTCIQVLDGPQIKDPIIFILHYIILHKLF